MNDSLSVSNQTEVKAQHLNRVGRNLQEEEGLLVKLDETRAGRPLSHAAVAAQWFSQDLFAAAEAEDDEQPPATLPSASLPGECLHKIESQYSDPSDFATYYFEY